MAHNTQMQQNAEGMMRSRNEDAQPQAPGGPERQPKDNWSFSKHQLENMTHSNKRLLDNLIHIKERRTPVSMGGGRSQNRGPNGPGSALLNRQREDKRVLMENIKLVDRLERVKGAVTNGGSGGVGRG